MTIVRWALSIAQDPKQTRWICPLLLLADVLLCGLIIKKVPYTEIDWTAYMEQVQQFIAGERDYAKIRGGTGPLVYPAAHVYIYRVLYDLTNRGKDILLAQYIFGGLYLVTLAVVMACYRQAKVPPYVFPLLISSRRLHSIFMLRLFNDCFAVFFLFVAIYCYQRRLWTLGSLMYSLALGVKMSVLLALPAVGVVLLQALGSPSALRKAGLMAQVQVLIAWPFASKHGRSYVTRAFEFSRAFLFKWTVNWRFVGEETFLSKSFSAGLLILHVVLLTIFITTRWLRPSGQSISTTIRSVFSPPSPQQQAAMFARVKPRFVLEAVLTANAIGMLCARSLHYQFYALIVWATPFLLWRSGLHPLLQYAVTVSQELAWNVYPSTNNSSMVVAGLLLFQVAAVWIGTRREEDELIDSDRKAQKPHSE